MSGDHFIARDIGFENAAGPEKHQAVALRVSADRAIFYNCQMDGYQDTLYAHTYRQYYRNCQISGTIDFIFGDSAALFQNCTMVLRKPMDNQRNIVTAQGRKDIRQPTGLVLQNCSFVAAPEYFPVRFQLPSFLGRPWKEFSRTIIMESFIDDVIHPEGWLPWNLDFALNTLFYTEFNNRGPASNKNLRVKWAGIKELPAKRIKRFTGNEFLEGKKWIKHTKVPYDGGFIFPVPEDNPHITYSPEVPEETKDLGKNREKTDYIFKAPPPPVIGAIAPTPDEDDHHKGGDDHGHSHGKGRGKGKDHHKKAPVSEISVAPVTSEISVAPVTSEMAAAPSLDGAALSPAGSEREKPVLKMGSQGGFSIFNFFNRG